MVGYFRCVWIFGFAALVLIVLVFRFFVWVWFWGLIWYSLLVVVFVLVYLMWLRWVCMLACFCWWFVVLRVALGYLFIMDRLWLWVCVGVWWDCVLILFCG